MVASILIVSVILCWGLGLGCVFLCVMGLFVEVVPLHLSWS